MLKWILLLLTAAALNAESSKLGAETAVEGVGIITSMGGELHAMRDNGTSRLLSVKSEIKEGDTLKTEKNSFARIKFVDGAEVSLLPNTQLKVDTYSYHSVTSPQNIDNILLNLTKGGIRSVTGLVGKRSPAAFKMNTPQGSVGVRGTDFGALLCNNDCANILSASGNPLENGLHTDTASGTIVISSAAGSIVLPAGSFGFTPSINIPPKLVPSSEGIEVIIPPSIRGNEIAGHVAEKAEKSETPEGKAVAERVAQRNQMKRELFGHDAPNSADNSTSKKPEAVALQQEKQNQQHQEKQIQQIQQLQRQQLQGLQQQQQQQEKDKEDKIKKDKKVK